MKAWRTSDGQIVRRILSGRSNAFLVSNGTRNVLIDTGHAIGSLCLRRNLAQILVPQDALAACVLTHSHFDHAGNAHRIQESFAAPLIIQHEEAGYLSRRENPMIYGTTHFVRLLTHLLGKRVLAYANYTPAVADITFDEQFDLNPFGLDAYPCIHRGIRSAQRVSSFIMRSPSSVTRCLACFATLRFRRLRICRSC